MLLPSATVTSPTLTPIAVASKVTGMTSVSLSVPPSPVPVSLVVTVTDVLRPAPAPGPAAARPAAVHVGDRARNVQGPPLVREGHTRGAGQLERETAVGAQRDDRPPWPGVHVRDGNGFPPATLNTSGCPGVPNCGPGTVLTGASFTASTVTRNVVSTDLPPVSVARTVIDACRWRPAPIQRQRSGGPSTGVG